MNQEYVRGAIARGVTKSKILFSHVLRNAWLPIITLIGIYFGVFLSGAAIVETIFSWQGIGQLAVEAVGRKDYPVIQADYFVAWCFICSCKLFGRPVLFPSRSACAAWKGGENK